MLDRASSVGTRLKDWNTKPMRSRRSLVRAVSFRAVMSVSSTKTCPEVGGVEAGEDVHHRGLAGAGGAHDGGEFAGTEADAHVVEGAHLRVAASVDLGDALESDDGRGRGSWVAAVACAIVVFVFMYTYCMVSLCLRYGGFP